MNATTIYQNIRKLFTLERLLLVGLVIFLLMLNRCNNRKYQNQLAEGQTKIDSLMLANQKWDSIHNKDGQTILLQTAIVTNSQKAIRDLTDSIFNLKKRNERKIKEVIAYYKNVTHTGTDTLEIAYVDKERMKRFSDSVEAACAEVIKFYRDSAVQVPRNVKDSSAYFAFDGTVQKNSFRINKIDFPDTLNLRIVETKGGFFKKNLEGKRKFYLPRSVEFQAFHTNPLVKTTQMNSVFFKPKARFRWLEKAILIAAGIYVGSKL